MNRRTILCLGIALLISVGIAGIGLRNSEHAVTAASSVADSNGETKQSAFRGAMRVLELSSETRVGRSR